MTLYLCDKTSLSKTIHKNNNINIALHQQTNFHENKTQCEKSYIETCFEAKKLSTCLVKMGYMALQGKITIHN